jgi:hypothetical protein
VFEDRESLSGPTPTGYSAWTKEQAFVVLRARARSTNRRPTDLARAIVDGADTTEVLGGTRAR